MKNVTKWIAVLLALALMMVMLGGCSGSKKEPEPTDEPQTESKTKQEAAESEQETAWPEKPVTVVVPYDPGGDSDFNCRLLAEKLTEKTGQNFVVQNISGNSGATGSRQALSADPDGYTILFNHTAFIINHFAGNSELTYDDMTFGAVVGMFPIESDILACQPSLGITKLSELKAYAEEHPGELIFGASSGTTVLVSGLRLLDAGIDITMVDTGGTAERMTAILGGHVDFTCVPRGNAADYLQTGELVEIENDLGMEIICPAYYQMNFPKGVDEAIVDKLDALLEDIITNDTDYADRIMDTYGQSPLFMNAADGEKFMRDMWDEFSQWDWS